MLCLACWALLSGKIDSANLDEEKVFRREMSYRIQSKHWLQSQQSFDDFSFIVDGALFDALPMMEGDGDGGGEFCEGLPWWHFFLKRCLVLVDHINEYPRNEADWKKLENVDKDLELVLVELQEKYSDDYDIQWIKKPHYPTDLVGLDVHVELIDVDEKAPHIRGCDGGQERGKSLDDAIDSVIITVLADVTHEGYPKAGASWSTSPGDRQATVALQVYSGVDNSADDVQKVVVKSIESIDKGWFTVQIVQPQQPDRFAISTPEQSDS